MQQQFGFAGGLAAGAMQKSESQAVCDRGTSRCDEVLQSVGADDVAPLRFSTSSSSLEGRSAITLDLVDRRFPRLGIEPLPERTLHIEGVLRTLPGLAIVTVFHRGMRAQRTNALIADGNDCFVLGIVSVGAAIVGRGDDAVTLEHGDATLISAVEPSWALCPAVSRLVAVSVQRAALALRVRDVETAVMRPIPRGRGALNLLLAYLGVLQNDLLEEDLRRHAADHVCDLVALTVDPRSTATDTARDRSVRAARLRAIKADIAENFGRFDHSIHVAAARHGLTPRYVRKLFEAEGATFSEFVLEKRLAHAHRLLTDPHCADRAISSIAYESGFGDLSYFNRTFRRAFGASPTDVRPGGRNSDGIRWSISNGDKRIDKAHLK